MSKFHVNDIDGCEFVKDSLVGKALISHDHTFEGYTGKIRYVFPDGSGGVISREEAQEKFDDGEWEVRR